MRKPLHPLIALALTLFGACTSSDDGARRSAGTPGGSIAVHPTQRAMLRAVGSDTLSDSAHVLRVVPEPDGGAVPFVFADPAARVSAALAITGGQAEGTQLLWPDSVLSLWWMGPHALAFTTATGRGVRIVVDVHAARLTVAEQAPGSVPAPARDTTAPSDLRARAQQYVDSLHVQPGGAAAQGSALRYQVGRLTMDPSKQLVAFHVVGLDANGRRSNPTWYAIGAQGGPVARIDGIIGDARDMAEDAGGWTGDQRFVFAKGLTMWDAHVMVAK